MNRFRQWLIDSYNGIYGILLKPQNPTGVAVAAAVVAMLFGILWGYAIRPVQYYNGAPYQLNSAARDQWIQFVAASREAGFYSDEDILRLLNQVEDPVGNIDRLINLTTGTVQQALINLRPLAVDANGTPVITGRAAPQPEGILSDLLWLLAPILLTIILAFPVSWLWRILIKNNVFDPIWDRVTPKSEAEKERRKKQQAELQLIRDARKREEEMREQSKKDSTGNPYGQPLIQKLSIYTKGRQYDDSFAIEDADGNFYGECGATIAKSINGSPAALEVWLFDKEDFVRTLAKVYGSEFAISDPATRTELEARVENPATDIILAQPGQVITLETDLILVRAKVVDMSYTPGTPTNATFEGITLQVEAWYKPLGAAAGAGTVATVQTAAVAPAAPQQTTYSPPMPQNQPDQIPTYSPPMPTPTNTPPPPPPPPPAPPKSNFDDDPFSGTGDFEPVNYN